MKVVQATPGQWADTEWRITPHVAESLVKAGYVGVMRYVSLPDPNDPTKLESKAFDVTGVEVGCILDAGLQLILVQHVRNPQWMPKAHDGRLDASAAAMHADSVGYPAGAHLFADWEGAAGTPDESTRYLEDWGRTARAGGFLGGLYVGYSTILSPDELYSLPDFTSYWSDRGPRIVSVRGFSIKQGGAVTVAGVEFDVDTVTADRKGDLPMVCGV